MQPAEELDMSFTDTLKTLGASAADLVATSRLLERHNSEERKQALTRRALVAAGKKIVEEKPVKPKSGRALTIKSVGLAEAGHPQTRVVRAKLLRAVNSLAKRGKKKEMTSLELFGETKRRVGKAPVKKKAK